MISNENAQIIADLFYDLDVNVRNDLHHNRIADERDYVSRLTTFFNYPFGIFNKYFHNNNKFNAKWYAKVNNWHHEQKFGCDSMIVFRVDSKIKVGLFEAKWPRVIKNPKYNWDKTEKKSKKSHFTSQIERQSKWANSATIWEMCFFEGKPGIINDPFDKYGSTCIPYRFAESLIKSSPTLQILWNNNDLKKLIKSAQKVSKEASNETNLKQMILDILLSSEAKSIEFEPTKSTFTLSSTVDEEKAICPILTFKDNTEDDYEVNRFMSQNGLLNFIQLDITL